MDKFINSFNESKSLTRVDSGMWEDGDKEINVLIEIKDYPFTLSMLKQVFTNIKTNQEYILQEMVDELNRRDDDGIQMYVKYKLDTRNRLEHFFGQCFVEAKTTKGDFTLEEELEKFTENNIISHRGKARLEEAKKLYPQYYDKTNPSKWAKFVGNAMYSDRGKGYLGNDGGDDGFNFRGRGIKQLTGKFNYKDFNKYAHNNYWLDEEVNFVNSPDLLILDGKYALVSAAYFWTIERPKPKKYRLYEIADESKADSDNSDIVERITTVINPQKLGLEHRKEAYKRIRDANIFKMFQ
ncbi:glycoside hydrolase family 19 protein [Campylobacter concisus]|uniref:glycoside hydrolase family 19 protein n=1 Tax=Campylobacter concisus TaxID=199 RepID=UPI0011E69B4D|nr:hypothetical protein [Campylobacter concisus]